MSTRKVLHLISQAHLDPVWLWPLRDGVAEALTTLTSAVERARETPGFAFTRSSAAVYRWAKEMDPALYRRIRRLVRAGRWEVVGGWVEQPDCNLPSAESFLRQGLYGKAFFAREFGAAGATRIGYNVDSFGHAGGLPQLLKVSGFDYYAFMRPEPWDKPDLPLLFWWESPDGARVLSQRIPGSYSQSYAATADDIEKAVRAAAEANFAPGFAHGVMWLGIGNHGGGPTREHLARIRQLRRDPSLPELRFSTLRVYFQCVEAEPAFSGLPVVREELQGVFRGCYAATSEVKALNRLAEKALVQAEQLGAVAAIAGAGRADAGALHGAWWRLLLNQFHDILAGTCVEPVQEDNRNRFGAVLTDAREVALRAAARLARGVDTRGEKGSVLFAANPLPWARTAIVQLDTFREPHAREEITHLEAPDGTEIPIQWLAADANFGPWGLKWGKLTAAVALPASGYRVFRVCTRPLAHGSLNPFAAADPNNPQFSGGFQAEQRTVKSLGSVPALASLPCGGGAELLAGPVGCVVISDRGSTWGHGVRDYREELGRPEPCGTEVLEDGPLVTVTRQKSRWDKSEIWMDVIRYRHTPHVELRLRFNWQQKRQTLKLEIPTPFSKPQVFAKTAGSVTPRAADGAEQHCQDWLALQGEGGRQCLGVINSSTYSCDALSGLLRFTLARGVAHAEHPPFEYKDDGNIPFLDQGWQERRFWLVAGDGEWTSLHLDRAAEEWQCPPSILLDSAHPGTAPREQSLLAVEPASVSVLALKPAEDGDGFILRLQEMAGRATRATVRIGASGHALPADLRAWEIATLRLRERDGSWRAADVDALEREIS